MIRNPACKIFNRPFLRLMEANMAKNEEELRIAEDDDEFADREAT